LIRREQQVEYRKHLISNAFQGRTHETRRGRDQGDQGGLGGKVVGKPESWSDLQGFFLGDQDVWVNRKHINLKKKLKRTIKQRIRQLERIKRK
jgi:hypothetical protein